MMAISNELLSTTLYSIRDKEVDELFRKVAFLENCKTYNGIEYENGGIKIQRPLALAEHSVITQLTTGYEPVSLAVQDVLQPAIYNWCDFTAPIVISEKEELENSGEKAIVKIVEVRMRSVMGMLKRELNKQILLGTSTILTEMNTLNGDKAGGFLEPTAAGTQVNTVGGIDKGVVSAIGWQNQLADAGGDFSLNGIRVMQQAQIEADSIAPMGTMDAVILSNACMANYRSALEVNVRYINAEQLNAGKMNLAFGDATVQSDSVIDYTTTRLAIGAKLSGYMINFEAIKMVFHSKGDFAVRPFEYIPGTATRSSRLYVKCQLIADHLGSCAVIINGETF